MEDDTSGSSDVEEPRREYIYGPLRPANNSACDLVLDLPNTFIRMKAHYGQFGFFDTSTVNGMTDAIKTHVSVLAVKYMNRPLLALEEE